MRFLSLTAALVLAALPALANDSTAELPSGGLVLTRTAQIAMDREDLFLSMDRITVRYEFRNLTDQDIDRTIAFPMPDIEAGEDMNISLPHWGADNFLGFTAAMNGTAVEAKLHQQAFLGDEDVTALLTTAGVPLNPLSDATGPALTALPQETARQWRDRGLIHSWAYDAGNGVTEQREPGWTLRSAYVWPAHFPAGQSVTVTHDYQPSLGGTAGISFFWDGVPQSPMIDDYRRRYCIDPDFEAGVARRADSAADLPWMEFRLDYILTSGANWAGGRIGKFTLTIDKGAPDNLVSFCGQGVTKIAPTQFQMTAQNFAPSEDLRLLFIARPAP